MDFAFWSSTKVSTRCKGYSGKHENDCHLRGVLCVLALPRAVIVNYFGSVLHVANTALWTVQYSAYSYSSSPEILLTSLNIFFLLPYFFLKWLQHCSSYQGLGAVMRRADTSM